MIAQGVPAQQPAGNRVTVGDTVTVVQRVAVPSGSLVRPRAPDDTLLATLVAIPTVSREGDSVRIAYPLSVWSTGSHRLVIPGAVVVRQDGTVDTLPDATVMLQVASVLPADATVESLPPREPAPWVLRSERSAWPFLILLLPLLVVLAIVGWLWRRRGRRPPRPDPVPVGPGPRLERLTRWIDAGEPILAIDHLGAILHDDPGAVTWREEVAKVRFSGDKESRPTELARAGIDLARAG